MPCHAGVLGSCFFRCPFPTPLLVTLLIRPCTCKAIVARRVLPPALHCSPIACLKPSVRCPLIVCMRDSSVGQRRRHNVPQAVRASGGRAPKLRWDRPEARRRRFTVRGLLFGCVDCGDRVLVVCVSCRVPSLIGNQSAAQPRPAPPMRIAVTRYVQLPRLVIGRPLSQAAGVQV